MISSKTAYQNLMKQRCIHDIYYVYVDRNPEVVFYEANSGRNETKEIS